MRADALFSHPQDFAFAEFFQLDAAPWEWVPQIKLALEAFDFSLAQLPANIPPGVHISGKVHIDPTVKLPPFACIQGPCWIGANTEIRPGAFIRGQVITGRGCVLGNSCEFKNALLLDGVQAPHFNYVGDSILGNKAHLGAGVICANLRLDQQPVPVVLPDGTRVSSGLRKLGAIMGDEAEAGCNSVLQPGAILGRRAVVLSMPFSGYLPADSIAHLPQNVRITPRR